MISKRLVMNSGKCDTKYRIPFANINLLRRICLRLRSSWSSVVRKSPRTCLLLSSCRLKTLYRQISMTMFSTNKKMSFTELFSILNALKTRHSTSSLCKAKNKILQLINIINQQLDTFLIKLSLNSLIRMRIFFEIWFKIKF